MEPIGYPADVRADYPERSSRLWAVLTIFWIKLFAIIPHGIILIFLGIAQWIVAFIAQFVVAFKGEYPAGMHEFVTGVLRWQTRVAAFILFEAWRRLSEAPEVASGLMLAVALVGLAANAGSLFLLRDAQRQSLNMRGAYLEVMGDFIGSAAVIVAAIVIALTGWTAADAVASALIGLLILPRTFALLREATDVLLEATPKGVDMDHVRQHILDAPGVVDCHDLHAWTITSGMNVVSAHVTLAEGADAAATLDALCECLSDDFDIEHSTFQLETVDRRRVEERSHV